MNKVIHVVHCIDTEGPLTEDLSATFSRLESTFGLSMDATKSNLIRIQNGCIEHKDKEQIKKMFSKELLKYNNSWADIDKMLKECMSKDFRFAVKDDFEGGWVYSWHCMDHVGYSDNPRRKDLGFGNIFRFYNDKLLENDNFRDEINWHFHPLAFDRNPLKAATSYNNSMDMLMQVICRRIIENNWFPVTNRPGFHSERPDSHAFLEQWIPFDYANQSYDFDDGQSDLIGGRFGDWRRATKSWRGYHPSHFDYQVEGNCRRKIFRCLNIGTRFNILKEHHMIEAFEEADQSGAAILSFANHDYRDIRPDVEYVREMLQVVRSNYPEVKVKFSGATEAARDLNEYQHEHEKIELNAYIIENKLFVEVSKGELFGPQPFLAIKTKTGDYFHDNFDVVSFGSKYSYVFDSQTINLNAVNKLGIASADRNGYFDIKVIEI
ncbi:hypothetical protein [Shewanella algae]|uniref:hypothetical protein n=1 Tax=Shewanella algae TaxID=38313 RepID=UPI001AAC58A4|nr:hypothetical protein [Shewanella algae]QTE80943.1 hypothetical protein JKK46_14780 [Shewanella algae]